jgi:hypothetical protein
MFCDAVLQRRRRETRGKGNHEEKGDKEDKEQ